MRPGEDGARTLRKTVTGTARQSALRALRRRRKPADDETVGGVTGGAAVPCMKSSR